MLREVCGEKVIVGEGLGAVNFGKLIALNETAAWLWTKASQLGDFTVQQLADELCKEYDVEKQVALKDIEGVIANWQEVGLLS